ncbi:MAG: winged helix-turn-helix domain-containing protein [Gammaproteobacteria bacterium]
MTARSQENFRIDDCEVYPSRNLITGPKGATRVEPKAMAVLVELASKAGETVSRRDLIDAVWPRGFVTDDVLTRCVTQLRKALGENRRHPRFLETVPRKGYRLLPRIAPFEHAGNRIEDRAQHPVLLVLPFQNLSGRQDQEYLADGMTELLIARLAAFQGLRVLSRTTAMSFKDRRISMPALVQEIGVAWIVEGSIMLASERLLVVAQLIDAHCDAHVWADEYRCAFTDLLDLQNDISTRVATGIRLRIAPLSKPERPPRHVAADAMRGYLKARQLVSRRTPRALGEALMQLAKVVEREPNYAQAWASMAEIHMLLAHYGAEPPQRAVPESRACVNRALALDPGLAAALGCQGALALFFDRDPEAAEASLRRALELQPSYSLALISMANVCAVRGEFTEANEWVQQALLIDPRDIGINMNAADHLILAGRYEEAARQLVRTLELHESHLPSRLRLVLALALGGNHVEAARQLENLKSAAGVSAQYWEYAALAAAAHGDLEEAKNCAAELDHLARGGYIAPWARARVFVAAGEIDRALDFLEQAAADQSSSLVFLGVTPVFEGLRGDPRMLAFMQRLGLPAPGWRPGGKPSE